MREGRTVPRVAMGKYTHLVHAPPRTPHTMYPHHYTPHPIEVAPSPTITPPHSEALHTTP